MLTWLCPALCCDAEVPEGRQPGNGLGLPSGHAPPLADGQSNQVRHVHGNGCKGERHIAQGRTIYTGQVQVQLLHMICQWFGHDAILIMMFWFVKCCDEHA
jgi:hypothetical protein